MKYTKIWYILVWSYDWHESCYYNSDDEKDYDKYNSEMNEILKSAELN